MTILRVFKFLGIMILTVIFAIIYLIVFAGIFGFFIWLGEFLDNVKSNFEYWLGNWNKLSK